MGRLHEATFHVALGASAALLAFCAPASRLEVVEVLAAAPIAPPDPIGESSALTQAPMVHVFDTATMPGGPHYVNDHTFVRAPDGRWHLFGIFHPEPMGPDDELDFVHAVADEPDPARWREGAFEPAPGASAIALRADRALGETHLWAPHVVADGGRFWMVYNGGGASDDHASIRVAVSDDLYRWERVARVPLFEDFCAARDPMLLHHDDVWVLYYTRCESPARKVSGVAYRQSHDLTAWTDARMALVLDEATTLPNSGFTESPFVFEKDGFWYLSVTSYPVAWDATFVYCSRTPFAFPDAPFTRLRAHAGEWISAPSGRTFVTHAGPGQRGVWISAIDGLKRR